MVNDRGKICRAAAENACGGVIYLYDMDGEAVRIIMKNGGAEVRRERLDKNR